MPFSCGSAVQKHRIKRTLASESAQHEHTVIAMHYLLCEIVKLCFHVCVCVSVALKVNGALGSVKTDAMMLDIQVRQCDTVSVYCKCLHPG